MLRALLPAVLLLAAPAYAAPVRTPHVEAELVAERTAIAPGEPLTVALRLKMIPEWHTYWRNPGDSGEPTRLAWQLPPGFAASEIHWPYPRRLPAGPLLNYGYEDEVLLLARITPPRDLAPGTPVTLAAKANWLVCSREHCIPEDGELSLTLPVAAATDEDPRWAKPIAAARAALPAPPAALSGWTLAARGEAGGVTLTLVPPADTTLRELVFFPFDQGKIEPAAPQAFARAENGYRLRLAAATQPVGELTRLTGVLVSPDGFGAATRALAATIDVPIAGAVTPAPAPPTAAQTAGLGLVLALVFAFVGGLALNLMPCVLPVLSIKVLGFAGRHDDTRTRRRYGLVYAAGVLASFWLLAAALLGLRALGAELGWGFQLQSPGAVAALALFFFVLALNLSGVFEIGVLLPDRLAAWRARRPALDWFGSGVLAVIVASPCTAPLMGAALGYAIGESGWRALAVFTALGLGMALPYVLLAWFPAWLARVPKPGPWMVQLKQALAFPLYAHRGVARLGARPAGGARRGRVAPRRARRARRRRVARRLPAGARRRGGSGALCDRDRRPGGPAGRAGREPRGRLAAVLRRARRVARRGRQAGVRRLHRGVVRHLPGQQAARARTRRRARGVPRPRRRARAGGLDPPRRRDHARPRRARPERRPGLRAIQARPRAGAAARGPDPRPRARRAGGLTGIPGADPALSFDQEAT